MSVVSPVRATRSEVVTPLWPRQTPPRPAQPSTSPGRHPGAGARWVTQLGRALHPFGDEPVPDAPGPSDHPVWTDSSLDLGGLPVLLVGGLASTPSTFDVMQQWLLRVNARPHLAPVRYGVDCGERTARLVAAEAHRLADLTGRRCVLVGHSRGGQFARAVAVRHREAVRGLVTLGTPINRLVGVRPSLRAEIALLGALGSLGVPDLVRVSCLWGSCCRELRADIQSPVPADLRYLSIYSPQDELVSWRSCLDPWARHRSVAASHSGLVCAPEVLQVLAEELGGYLGPCTSAAQASSAVA